MGVVVTSDEGSTGENAIEHATWVRTWDERIARWIEQGQETDMGCADIWRSYRGSGKTAINERAMPEPYAGDPLSEQLVGVALNLNPGAGIAPQLWYGAQGFSLGTRAAFSARTTMRA